MTATTKGSKGTRVALMAWHRRLGHLSFKTVERGASGMVITDLPVRIPGLGVCAACVAEMSVHLSHKEGRGKACKYLERVHIYIGGQIPGVSAEGWVRRRGWLHSCSIYKAAAPQVGGSQSVQSVQGGSRDPACERVREITMGNTHEVLMGKMRDSIMLHTTVPHYSAPNGVAERMIGVLIIAVHTGRGWV